MSQFPAWTAGSKVTAAGLLQMEPWVAMKPSDTARASTTTITQDPDLTIPNLPIGTFLLDGLLVYNGAALGTGDLKLSVTANVGSVSQSFFAMAAIPTSSATALQPNAMALGGTGIYGTNGTGVNLAAHIKGTLQVTTNPSTVSLFWAQNTSVATATTLKAGSWMSLLQIA